MKYGFLTVAAAIPSVRVADIEYNLEEIKRIIGEAERQHVEVVVFPELSITGYTCQDLFRQRTLIDGAELAVLSLLEFTMRKDIIVIVGAPIEAENLLLNCAVVIQQGRLLGVVPKTFLPNYSEFYEKRWFASAQDLHDTPLCYAGEDVLLTARRQIFHTYEDARFAVEICEDVWSPNPPSTQLALSGADIVFNLSASDELIGKHSYLIDLLKQQSARNICGYVYSGSGYGESTQDVVYGGNALIFENGRLTKQSQRFSIEPQLVVSQIDIDRLRAERRSNSTYVNAQQALRPQEQGYVCITNEAMLPENQKEEWQLLRHVDAHPFIPKDEDMMASCEEILSIQTLGLCKRIAHTHAKTVVIGISGGLDSTLALLVCVRAFDKLGIDRSQIVAVTMPGMGTTGRTHRNALSLMEALGVSIHEISIAKAVAQHFADIGHDAHVHDTTYENAQARERTQILMDLSNEYGGLVIGTGDLSELALGWCTYNGDHMSMYAVNASIPKTLIRHLVAFVADTQTAAKAQSKDGRTAQEVLHDVIDTPISPELTPADEQGNIAQKTEDLVGPYELHDFFLYYFLRFGFRPKKIFMLAIHAFEGIYTREVVQHWLHTFFWRFFSQQFKRSCLPDGPKVGSVSLSPRGDWRMPSDAVVDSWMREVDEVLSE